MAIVIFIAFRTFVPATAVVLSAFADMVMTAAVMNIVGIQLTLGTVAALLMLIGYSVDSDILLTNRVLKRQGKLNDKLTGAFHTGIIMTSTTLAAAAAMFIVSWLGSVQILWEISAVLLIGLVFDIMNTWLTNVGTPQMVCPEGRRQMNAQQIKKLLLDWRVAALVILVAPVGCCDFPAFRSKWQLASNLQYGLDLQQGAWLQLELKGEVVGYTTDQPLDVFVANSDQATGNRSGRSRCRPTSKYENPIPRPSWIPSLPAMAERSLVYRPGSVKSDC